ncbi:MAG: hypothetical protein KBC33_01630 [Candidatus Pacebacteria bacterium]|nr:hypothetical protein [Candidatus Paceibacterota bacterium]
MITYDDFKKVEIRAGKILSAEKIPDTDKLLKLSVDFGTKIQPVQSVVPPVAAPGTVVTPEVPSAEIVQPAPEIIPDIRQIVSGISMYFPDPATLVGKTCMFVTNLEPRKIKGYESNGMLFAVSDANGNFSLLEPNTTIQPGTKAA